MRLKIFTADNMQAALLMVREALGNDAIIIDTTEEKGKVKVTAAIEIPVAKVSARKASKPRPKPAPVKKSLKELQQDEQSESVNLSHFLSHHDIPKVMMKRILETAFVKFLAGEDGIGLKSVLINSLCHGTYLE
ncbi:MAG: hypothetical protein JKY59_08365, partial [Emcibacter sp.]|nr:hypothetical protein [Emcibacter sp.]